MFREELDAQKELEQEQPFVKQFYVVENLQAVPLKIERFGNLDDAMSQYQALPNHYMKALGVEKNPDPLPGSLDILQCRNGIDTIVEDYKTVPGWDNPYIQNHVVQPLQGALAVQDVELAYELPDAYFHIQTCEDGFDYTLYNKDFTERDGGILEMDGDKPVQEAMTELLAEFGCDAAEGKVMDAAELWEQADTVAEQQAEVLKEKLAAERPAPEETLSFYVAECLEFTFAGEFHDHMTMEEALEAYDKIPSERMNADKCIGFCIEEDGGFVGMYELVTKNNGNRCSAYVPEHHEAIVSPGIARAAHLVASSKKKCGVQDIVVIQQGALKGFVGIHPNWSGISVDSIHSLCLRAYLPEEVAKLNDIAEMRAGTKLEKPLRSEYLTISGTCFINQSSPVITISKNGIRFSKACHTRLDDCEHVELLYHPILQVVILRKSNRDASTAIHWENKDKICSSFSSRAFSGVIFEAMNWKWSCRYQCRGICRGEENAKFLIFELDESRILIRKNQYEQIEDRSMNLKCRLYRSKWVQSITVSDVMESGQVVENPMIGAIPSRNEVQRELDDLLMSM